jgi:hypothetical protein
VGLGTPVGAFLALDYSISLSLNVILTLMITARLILHHRNLRNAIGASSGVSGLYTTIVTILVESCALYAITFLPFIVSDAVGSYTLYLFEGFDTFQVRSVLISPRQTIHRLIIEVDRSSHRSLSFYESQTGVR